MYKNILFPVDVSEKDSWQASLQAVVEYAQAFKSKLHVMMVISDSSMNLVRQFFPKGSVDTLVDETKKALKAFVDENIPKEIDVQRIIAKGPVYECIIKTADEINADLIVMQAHRPELKDYLLGPNAAKVVRHSKRSVLVVRDTKQN
jgi:nucleotide-binding universal stress UspA family protein